MSEVANFDRPRGHTAPHLSALEQQILGDWGDQGLPNIEAIHELGCDILRMAVMDMGEPPHPRTIVPDEEHLSEELLKMIEKIPHENCGLDVVYRIRNFVTENAVYRDPTDED